MPEGRRAPWKYLPRPGARLSVTFGEPLPHASVRAVLGTRAGGLWPHRRYHHRDEGEPVRGAEVDAEAEVRIALTELVQRAVEALGRQVSGDMLTGLPPRT
jgi:monolysocardiolipin acyltransferase